MMRWARWFSYAAVCSSLLVFCAGCAEKRLAKDEAPPPSAERHGAVAEEIPPAPSPAPQADSAGAPSSPRAPESAGSEKDLEVRPGRMPDAPAENLSAIYFDYDKAVITSPSQETLRKNRDYLMTRSELRILIEGHCDERGTNEYNLALGDRRAAATRRYLADLGVDPGRLDVISYGEERPADPAGNETAWAKNRRAEFKER